MFGRCVDAPSPLVSWSVDFEPGPFSLHSFEKKERPVAVGTYSAAAAAVVAALAAVVVVAAEVFLATVAVD